ncbi:MAG: flagellar biosynthesis anti-sigma factor FlgM [Gammaproteobacteria bacterium]|nr:flagellar biosynthesis anti-sigma factor FlgM [Gammaproteobacteria bacterium]MCW8983628.1 flagellar biosynthesis anti-sigma factor FlgM [Gammaproteobacteria bacterium]
MPVNNITGFQGTQSQRNTENSQVQVSRGDPAAHQQETGTPSTVDTVSLTDTSMRLQSLENRIASLPVVDSQRVEDIRQSVENGSYTPDAEAIASKIVESELGLLNG